MSNEDWCNKNVVLKDLAKATGRRLKTIDRNFYVVGESAPPPPVRNYGIDDEMRLRFHYINRTNENNIAMKPDLKGISDMLRLVKDHNDSPQRINKVKACVTNQPAQLKIISISKLNPNVVEFVPKSSIEPSVDLNKDKDTVVKVNKTTINVHNNHSQINDCKSSDININDIMTENGLQLRNDKDQVNSNDCKNYNQINVIVKKENGCSKDNGIVVTKQACDSTKVLISNEIQAIATELKKKITIEPTTFQARRERNVAITNLQKLYSLNPRQYISNGIDEPFSKVIKLITPDFFEKFKADHVDVENKKKDTNNVDIIKPSKTALDVSTSSVMLYTNENENKKVENKSSNFKEQDPVSDLAIDDSNIRVNASDLQVQNSIKKVKNWLNKPDDEKPKGPVVYLGPVSFKRKEVTKSLGEINKKISQSNSNATRQYIPSEYANELSRFYMERAKTKDKKSKELLSWENLTDKLTEKDIEIIISRSENISLTSSELSTVSDIDTQAK